MSRRTAVAVTATALLVFAAACSTDPAAQTGPSRISTSTTVTSTTVTSTTGISSAPSDAVGATAAPTSAASALSSGPETTPVFTPQRVAPTTAAGVDASAGVDRTDPDAVTTAVLTTFFTADTTVDDGPNDAAARAGALLTPAYAATILGSPPVIGAGAQWDSWATRGVQLHAQVAALPDDRPADTATTAFRIDLITQTPTTSAGQALAPVVVVAYVALEVTPAGWAVASVEQR